MSLDSLRAGVPWDWKSTADYLGALDGRLGINAGFMVGHSALRRVVMARRLQPVATDDEIAAMTRLLHEGLEAGGIGFSSSWARTHNDAAGTWSPPATPPGTSCWRCAGGERARGTSLEFIPMVGRLCAVGRRVDDGHVRRRGPPVELERDDGDRGQRGGLPGQARGRRLCCAAGRQGGGAHRAHEFRGSVELRLRVRARRHAGMGERHALTPAAKLEVFRDPVGRARLNALAQSPSNPLAQVANWSTRSSSMWSIPTTSSTAGVSSATSPGNKAGSLGRLCDIAWPTTSTRASHGAPAETDEDWAARLDIWRDHRAVIGASDAGAHLDLLASFNYTTELLGKRCATVTCSPSKKRCTY